MYFQCIRTSLEMKTFFANHVGMKYQHFTQKKLAADQPVVLLVQNLSLELLLSCNGKHEKHKKRQQTGRMHIIC